MKVMNKKILQKTTMLLMLSLLMMGMPLNRQGIKPTTVLAATETPYVRFETAVTGLNQPLFATHAGDGSGRIFIVERGGKIRIYKNGALNATPFLNISSLVTTSGIEQGLLGLTFHPNYGSNRFLYVVYTEVTTSDLILARYRTLLNDPDRVRKASAKILLRIPEPHANHNGSTLAFGPDGYLYMSVGDGGWSWTRLNNSPGENPAPRRRQFVPLRYPEYQSILFKHRPFSEKRDLGLWLTQPMEDFLRQTNRRPVDRRCRTGQTGRSQFSTRRGSRRKQLWLEYTRGKPVLRPSNRLHASPGLRASRRRV